MMRAIRNIGSIFLVALLITATGGVSIFHHFCHCVGEVSTSVFLEADCNHGDSSRAASCDYTGEAHSCCMEKPAQESKQACHDEDCCQTSETFLKIFDSFQPGLEKISLKPFMVASALLSFDILADDNLLPHLNTFNADLPPPDSGKQIVVALHQLKLDHSLV